VAGLKSAGTDGLECRILDFLLREASAKQSKTVHLTHEAISNYLGTSRVVVSRILKDCEKRGKLTLNRGRITLTEAL
jgi:CRP/FNR family transcriptional regulator